jgi:hypothetical protein
MNDTASSPPPVDFNTIRRVIVEQLRHSLDALAEIDPSDPLAAIVLWASPFKGWYEVHFDTLANNVAKARERNARMLTLAAERAADDDAWKTASTTSRRLAALPYNPEIDDFTSSDDAIHAFDIDLSDFLYSTAYAALNVGGEDGWLEGHLRFVFHAAITELVAERAFDRLPRAPQLYVGYAYPDSSHAIIVAIVES